MSNKTTTVQELIEQLQQYSPDMEVLITDGFNALCYKGQYQVKEFTDVDGKTYVDIGIGGCLQQA